MRMAVATYATGISTPEVHPEFPPLLGTLTTPPTVDEGEDSTCCFLVAEKGYRKPATMHANRESQQTLMRVLISGTESADPTIEAKGTPPTTHEETRGAIPAD